MIAKKIENYKLNTTTQKTTHTVTNQVLKFLHSASSIYKVFLCMQTQSVSTQCLLVVHVYEICQICLLVVEEISNIGVYAPQSIRKWFSSSTDPS